MSLYGSTWFADARHRRFSTPLLKHIFLFRIFSKYFASWIPVRAGYISINTSRGHHFGLTQLVDIFSLSWILYILVRNYFRVPVTCCSSGVLGRSVSRWVPIARKWMQRLIVSQITYTVYQVLEAITDDIWKSANYWEAKSAFNFTELLVVFEKPFLASNQSRSCSYYASLIS